MLDGDAPVVDLLADAEPPGRRGRVPRPRRGDGRGRRPAQGRGASRTGCCEPQSHWSQDDSRIILGYRCANSGMTHRRRRRPHDRAPRTTTPTVIQRRRGHRQDGLPGAGQAGRADPDHQDRRATTPRAACPSRELVDRCRRTLDRVREHGRRAAVRRAAGVARRLLGALRRRGRTGSRRCSRRCAGTCSSSPRPRPAPSSRRPGQGRDRLRLRRPLLLGHRDLRAAVPHLHHAAVARSALRFRYSMLDAARARAPRAGPARRAVPVAHDQRRGGVGVLRGRHRAVPHRRRHRLRAVPSTSRATGDQRVPEPRGRRHPRRDRADVGRPRLLARATAAATLPHPRRHRPGRVHDGRQRQPVHQRDGAVQPAPRRADGARRSRATTPRRYAAAGRSGSSSTTGEVEEWAARRRGDAHPVRRAPRHPPAGRALPRARGVGPRRTRRRRSGRCCCTTTRW